jgi:hypothetical protein
MSERAPTSSEERFVRRALALRAALRDPALPGLAVMAGLVIVGFGAMAFTWYGVAGTVYVPLQIPRAISGGIGGLALIGMGVALFDLQVARRATAGEQKAGDDLLDEVAELTALAPRLRGIAARRRAGNARRS